MFAPEFLLRTLHREAVGDTDYPTATDAQRAGLEHVAREALLVRMLPPEFATLVVVDLTADAIHSAYDPAGGRWTSWPGH